MKALLSLTLIALLCVPSESKGEELSAKDLARALGVYWWVVQLPDSDEPLTLRFVTRYSDGTMKFSGAMGGFEPGTKIKAYCWPAEDKEWLNVSITSDKGVMKTKIKNPFSVAKITSYPIDIGEEAGVGDFLMKGSTGKGVSTDQDLDDGEFGLSVGVKP